MLLLEAKNIKKFYGPRLVLQLDELGIYSGDKIGVVGPNGSGKTTLLDILSGNLIPEEGHINCYGKLSYLPQLAPVTGQGDYQLLKRLDVLNEHPHLSGGEQTRRKLATALSKRAHLLFGDEPTTNLDVAGISFLEEQLIAFDGAILLVSHDRHLLDQVCSKILEVNEGKLRLYPGNYQQYQTEKEREVAYQQFSYEQFTKEKQRLQQAIVAKSEHVKRIKKTPKRMGNSEARLHKRSSGTIKAKLAKSVKALESRVEQLEVVDKPSFASSAKIDFCHSQPVHNKYLLQIDGLNTAFGERRLFADARLAIRTNSKVALIGPNGSGKTTLVELILAGNPSIKLAKGARIGYFNQDLSLLNQDETLLADVMSVSSHPEAFVRLILARLLFTGDDVHKPVKVLSGGERVKAAFAKIICGNNNFLILDEPTNYLDIASLEALGQVLKEYPGTVLVISHDRRFVDEFATDLLIIEDQQIKQFSGNYTLWQQAQEEKRPSEDLLLLENRLAELTSRLSMPQANDDIAALDQEFRETLRRKRMAESATK